MGTVPAAALPRLPVGRLPSTARRAGIVTGRAISVGHDRLELSANGLREQDGARQSEALREGAAGEAVEGAGRDPACFSVRQDDSSRIFTGTGAECNDESPSRTRRAPSTSDDVEAALAKGLVAAAEAGRFDVVAQLAKELEARRLTRLDNVVKLPTRARRRET